MYEDEFMVLNMRLKQYGYESSIALLRDFKNGTFPEQYFKPQGALHMGTNESTSGAVSLLDDKPNPDFFNHIDYEKMYEFYRNELKLSQRYSRSCCNYLKYNWRVFFGDHPEELQKLTVDQRQWIVLSFRNFAKYYLRLTGSDDVEEAVRLAYGQTPDSEVLQVGPERSPSLMLFKLLLFLPVLRQCGRRAAAYPATC
jgi:hypothetical protein